MSHQSLYSQGLRLFGDCSISTGQWESRRVRAANSGTRPFPHLVAPTSDCSIYIGVWGIDQSSQDTHRTALAHPFPAPSRRCARVSKSGSGREGFVSPTRRRMRAIKSGGVRLSHGQVPERSARPRARDGSAGFRALSAPARARVKATSSEFRGHYARTREEVWCGRRQGFVQHYAHARTTQGALRQIGVSP